MSHFWRAIVILADGARPDVLSEEMRAGRLPNLARLCEGGTHQPILSCFPSTTGPAYLPYLTGCFPGTCNIPGIRWFDKPTYARRGWGWRSFRSYCGWESLFLDGDMNPAIRTAWEFFDKPRGIFAGITKGLPRKYDLTRWSRLWHSYYAHLNDHWSFIDQSAYARLVPLIRRRDFDFVFMVYPSVDEYSHLSSPFHSRVRQAYAEIDTFVGGMVGELRAAGILDETLIILVADHGLSATRQHFDIGPWLETHKKIRTFYYTDILKFRFEAASMISGNGMCNLYFKGENGWGYRKTFEEISHGSIILDELRFRQEIDLVTTMGADGRIHLQTARGHGSDGVDATGRIDYQFDRDDPLGLFIKGDLRLAAGFTLDESLALTFDSHYPDVFMQMHQLFRSPRAGDVLVSARTGFDLRARFEHPEHKSSHGSICPEHMRVPLIMNHRIDRPHLRSVDVFPIMLRALGKAVPAGIDGV
jgi:hypothetical protein